MKKHIETAIFYLSEEIEDLQFKIKGLDSELKRIDALKEISGNNFDFEIHACEYSKAHFNRLIDTITESINELKKEGK